MQKWEDKRLAWNATSWGCDNALVSSERLWLPDVSVLSAATVGSTSGDMGLRARLTSDGRVSWAVRFDLTAPITLSLEEWPKDKHEAAFKFGSRSYSVNELNLSLSDSEVCKKILFSLFFFSLTYFGGGGYQCDCIFFIFVTLELLTG